MISLAFSKDLSPPVTSSPLPGNASCANALNSFILELFRWRTDYFTR